MVDTSVTTLWRRREENYPAIAARLAEMVREVPGNCLALFPSYAFLEQIAARMPRLEHQVLVQRQADDSEAREALLDRLRGILFSRVLLLSVAGGVFAEGVDYPGDMLQAVIVVGPCLPSVGLEQKLLQDHFEERFEKGFEYAFVVPGMTRVIQAAGRLIRSASDRGVIALLDRRFLDLPYVGYLPTDWIPEEGPGALAGNPAEVARSFFAAKDVAREAGAPKKFDPAGENPRGQEEGGRSEMSLQPLIRRPERRRAVFVRGGESRLTRLAEAAAELLEVLLDQPVHADALQLGGEDQDLIGGEGVLFVEHVEDALERGLELGIVRSGRSRHPCARASAASCMVLGS